MPDATARLRFLFQLVIAIRVTMSGGVVRAQEGTSWPVQTAAAHVAAVTNDRGDQSGIIARRLLRDRPEQDREGSAVSVARHRYPPGSEALGSTAGNGFDAREELPSDFNPWWQSHVKHPLRGGLEAHPVDVEALIVSALAFSPYVRAVSQEVLIQETEIIEAESEFDVSTFVDTKFFRKSEPTGNRLETGGPPRLREEDFGYAVGWRKRTPLGGSWELSQRIGMRDSNSRFFSPEQQGNSRFSLSFNQPLFNGFGRAYNTALIVLAEIDTTVTRDNTFAALQDHLIKIAKAYWELYLQRSALIQNRRHLERAEVILERLTARQEVDVLQSQIVRARAAVATRQAKLIRSSTSIRNVEAKLRSLTNSPELQASPHAELLPRDDPAVVAVDIRMPDAMTTALRHRPEIDAAAQEIRAAAVRLNMSRNELLPALDLVLETYVSGLDQDYDIFQAFSDQFSVGEPSYTAGLLFEVPLRRRAAKARYERRRLQHRQLVQQFEQTVQVLLSDVEIAVREVDATYRELIAKHRAMKAAEAEVDYLTKRWELFSGDDRTVSFMLEDLLDAQDRLAEEEYELAVAYRDYVLSQTFLKRATGTLLEQEHVEPLRAYGGGVPDLHFNRAASTPSPNDVLPPPARGEK